MKVNRSLIGIAGAGTMGSGIALAALYQALPVLVYDVSPSALENVEAYTEKYLAKKGLQAYQNKLRLTSSFADLAEAGFVIEAVPEDLALKKDLIARLDELCPPPAILATNTSTLSVSAIASAAQTPDRVIGLHFFNPAPVMTLVEVIRSVQSCDETIDASIALAKRLGKTPVLAADSPGFIVNRVARPYYSEALRLAGERVTTPEQIDWVAEKGASFRMGPFHLMDLIGLDINLAAMQSMYEQTFGEPRYRPHPLQASLVAQQRLGVKTGRGFFQYNSGKTKKETGKPLRINKRDGLIKITPGTWGPDVAGLFKSGGFTLLYQDISTDRQNALSTSYPVAGLVLASRDEGLFEWVVDLDRQLSPKTPLICQAVDTTVHEIATYMRHPDRLVGFDGLFTGGGEIVTLVPGPGLADQIRGQVADIFQDLGRQTVWIADSPGLILPRIVGMLVNEASFAVLEGVAEQEMVDLAMRLGANYPHGPVAWGRAIGFHRVVSILDHLRREYGEERYRASVLLRRWARLSANSQFEGKL